VLDDDFALGSLWNLVLLTPSMLVIILDFLHAYFRQISLNLVRQNMWRKQKVANFLGMKPGFYVGASGKADIFHGNPVS
jgi:hypothetical protein